MAFTLRRLFFGKPLRSDLAIHERLSIPFALPIFASDALSSVAYATEAILIQLADTHLNRRQFGISFPIAVGIVTLILMVVISYWQIINEYPTGGGAYIVAKDNLGERLGLLAASALLVDYVLTVAVSIAEGVAAAFSALDHVSLFHSLEIHKVIVCLLLTALVMLLNLRGTRESGFAFAVPSYLFIVSIFVLILWGVPHALLGGKPVEAVAPASMSPLGPVGGISLFLIMRAFASGCSALTGIEAVSNGVQAFRRPEARNASVTLGILGALLAFMFVGITYLANHYGIVPGTHLHDYGGVNSHETVVSQIARATFGLGIPYYVIQAATAVILLLAANTSFAGFPRLASILAQDGYLPKQFASLGERLAFNNGIIVLALLAGGFIVAFGGETHALLPLYTVGVFIAFTLSQAGMVVRWHRHGTHGLSFAINAVGCLITGLVFVIVLFGKFWVIAPEATLFRIGGIRIQEGAWIALLLMGAVYGMFRSINTHYLHVATQLADIPPGFDKPFRHTVVVLVPSRLHRGVILAMRYAESLSPTTVALHIAYDAASKPILTKEWKRYGGETPLIIIDSPFRALIGPLAEYLTALDKVYDDDIVTVVLPEFVPAQWWHRFLHNATAWLIRAYLFNRPDIVLTSVRYYLDR